MNDKNIEALGLVLKNTYFIADYEPAKIGKMVMNLVKYFEQEELRDFREKANQAQYRNDKTQNGNPDDQVWDEKRIDVIGQNGATGEHYEY